MKWFIILAIILVNVQVACHSPIANTKEIVNTNINVIAYYSGDAKGIDGFEIDKLSHIIFSFCHLKGARLNLDNERDTMTIKKLVSLKEKKPSLKILFSLGGWGGCSTCSPVFSDNASRKIFASSVSELCNSFNVDGIDLDWEYPAIEGYPGHAFIPADRSNFTALVRELRTELGNSREISFAAGGFKKFFDESIEWKEIMPLLDRVNLMSYDLVGGYSKMTGHHTPLYSNSSQTESADRGIRYLDSLGVPLEKIVIGAAFYARTWEGVTSEDNGLYKPGKFKSFIAYHQFERELAKDSGFQFYRDTTANAPYAYNSSNRLFATFDDEVSIEAKTRYALQKKLNGIMFWELSLDKRKGGLLSVINNTISNYNKR